MTSRTGSGGFGSAGFAATAAAASGGGSAGVSNSAGSVLAPAVTTVTTTTALVQKRLSTVIRVPCATAEGHSPTAALRHTCAGAGALV
jgi:hypothetical protein